jgi:hypothetical protein
MTKCNVRFIFILRTEHYTWVPEGVSLSSISSGSRMDLDSSAIRTLFRYKALSASRSSIDDSVGCQQDFGKGVTVFVLVPASFCISMFVSTANYWMQP